MCLCQRDGHNVALRLMYSMNVCAFNHPQAFSHLHTNFIACSYMLQHVVIS